MTTYLKVLNGVTIAVLCFVLALVTACASQKTTATQPGDLKVAAVPSKGIGWQGLDAQVLDGLLRLQGTLYLGSSTRGMEPGHVDYMLSDEKGSELKHGSLPLSPRVLRKNREASFDTKLKVNVPLGSKVALAYHAPVLVEDRSFECGDNQLRQEVVERRTENKTLPK